MSQPESDKLVATDNEISIFSMRSVFFVIPFFSFRLDIKCRDNNKRFFVFTLFNHIFFFSSCFQHSLAHRNQHPNGHFGQRTILRTGHKSYIH